MQQRNDSAPQESAGSTAVGLLAFVLIGIVLRVWGAEHQWILTDEVFSLRAAVQHDFAWIWSHFGFFDHCIPLTLYVKWLLQTGWLNEWSYRLPTIVAGCLAVVGFCLLVRLTLAGPHALLSLGVFAVTPYFVFQAREARPYSIVVLLFGVGWVLAMAWYRKRRRSRLVAAAAFFAFAAWFHPIIAPSLAALALFLAGSLLVLSDRSPRFVDGIWAAALFLALCAILIGPALEDLLAQVSLKSGKGRFDLDSLSAGLMLLHGLPVQLSLLAWAAMLAAGLGLMGRHHGFACICLVAMLVAQLAFLFIRQPSVVESTAVWFRYLAHLWPFVIILVCAPVAVALGAIETRLTKAPAAAWMAVALVLALFVAHVHGDRYALGRAHASNMDPRLAYLSPESHEAFRPSSAFYSHRLLADADQETGEMVSLIEAPYVGIFPIFALYQRTTHRPILAGVLGQGFPAATFRGEPPHQLRTVIDLESPEAVARSGARFLVWHKHVQRELEAAMRAALEHELASLHAPSARNVEQLANVEYGRAPPRLPRLIPASFESVYEDDLVIVFAIEPR